MLAGLVEAGVDLRSADMVIGTSAGANVGAQILSGVPIEELYARQLKEPAGEIPVRLGIFTLLRFAGMLVWPGDERKNRARLGRAALRAQTMTEATRRAIVASRLPVNTWPDRQLLITAVDAESGEFLTFNRQLRRASGLPSDDDQRASLHRRRDQIGDQRRSRCGLQSGGGPGSTERRGAAEPASREPGRLAGFRHSLRRGAGRCAGAKGDGPAGPRSRVPRSLGPRRARPGSSCRERGRRGVVLTTSVHSGPELGAEPAPPRSTHQSANSCRRRPRSPRLSGFRSGSFRPNPPG